MAGRIEDYGIIGDTRTVALVDRTGSIDWWCVPRIDSGAVFASLLGTPDHGRWHLAPVDGIAGTRRYLHDTLVIETEHTAPQGRARVLDFMLPGSAQPTIFRIVEGMEGTVEFGMELIARFDYGSVVPWVTATGDGLTLVAGPDALRLFSPVPLTGEDHRTTATFTVGPGQRRAFSLAWYPSVEAPPMPLDAFAALTTTARWWREWAGHCVHEGPERDEIVRSLLTLKALTYAPTGAIVAAATTSLPEQLGGVRNWDYRFSWLRDASFTLQALALAGHRDEAMAWSAWLARAVAGDPSDFQIMYDVDGRRRLTEIELDWLPGYEGSAPVRIGNAASGQFQLDVVGEVLDARWEGVRAGLTGRAAVQPDLLRLALERLDARWGEPDDGIWEIRGQRQHFTHSKVMAWVAYDRAIRLAGLQGRTDVPLDAWASTRDEIHAQICDRAWNAERGTFTQYYGGTQVDASLLVMARVGFLPPEDPRLIATIETVQRDLEVDGFLLRYRTEDEGVDGLPAGEGVFIMTTLWLADALHIIGRTAEAREIYDRVRGIRNDLGLLSEEYDPRSRRMLGNFPQAFSHLGLVQTGMRLAGRT